jgi:hypothetical protein
MPKEGAMAQISRPFQIALLAIVLLAGVWLFALHGRPQTSESGSSATPASTPSPAAKEKAAATPTSTYKGAAPGVGGLTGAVAKANGAVATSQQNAKQLEQKSAQASSSGAAAATSTGAARVTSTAAPTSTAQAPAAATKAPAAPAVHAVGKGTPQRAASPSTPAGQKLVESELSAGNVVVLLFWDRKGADDVAVQHALATLARSESRLSVHQAGPGAVASFGAITRGVGVYGTPTLLVLGKHGAATVVTGLTDPFSIRQAITEARSS